MDKKTYRNPVIPGQFADPDIAVFGDRYYLYMTTDGFTGWSGTIFHVFSSENLVDWTDEGVILDVASDDVAWSTGSAWAPTIATRNGKFYFYFCAKDTTGTSCIGVAVADAPEGPFTAQTEPLMTMDICRRNNIKMGQTIDPSVFKDEDGTYHFTWSCDDTGSPNYHVNYGISNSIYGPIDFKYTVLEKREQENILGTGHHCMLQIPGTDEYYIAYHRFFTPLGTYTEGLGFHRETCIDRVTFDKETGLMNRITPTKEGVEPRYLK